MPLNKGKSKQAVSENIKTEQKAGKPHDQAVAIALHTQHPNEKGYADGGEVDASPLDQLMNAPRGNPMAEDDAQPGIGEITIGVQSDPKDNFYRQVGQGTTEGVNHDLDAVKDFIMQLYGKAQNGPIIQDSTLNGLQGLADKAGDDNQAAGNRISTDNGFSTGGAITSPHREKSGPGINTTPHEKYAYGGPVKGYADGTDPNEITDTSGIDALAGASASPAPITFDPTSGLPPTPPITAPAAVSPDISNYIQQQKQAISQYGPEQQMAVSNHILGAQNGLQGRLANAGAGLGDAIVQGVARAGNPGFQQNLQNRQDKQAELQLNALKGAREANVQNVEAGQKLDTLDPNSKVSKASQASNGLFLSALGFDPKTISMMSASQIPEAISTIKDLGIKDRELAVAKFKAQIEANQLAETSRHNVADEAAKLKELSETAKQHGQENAIKGEEVKTGALEHSASEPLTSRIAQLFGANPSGQALQQQALAGTGVKPTGQLSVSGPYGQTVQKGGKTYVWSPISQQYHPE